MTTEPTAPPLPIWLQIVFASVPILAAIIAGSFAWTNTVGRRIERLDHLTDLYVKFPKELNLDHALEVIMLRELQAIEWSITPTHKWNRRIHVIAVITYIAGTCLAVIGMIYNIGIVTMLSGLSVVVGSVAIAIGVIWLNFHVPPLRAGAVYTQKIDELKPNQWGPLQAREN